jgi:hypothetical protein
LADACGKDLGAMHGQQRLVGGDHVLAVRQWLRAPVLGNAVAANQLDDDVDVGVGRHGEDIVGNRNTGRFELRVWRTRGNLRHFNPAPCTAGNFFSITLKYVEGAATDGPLTHRCLL